MGTKDVHFYFEVSGYESKFRVIKFGGTESISQLFRYEIYVGSDDDNVPLEDIIGRPAVLMISRDGQTRDVSGMVSRFWWIGESGSYTAYYIELVPAIWYLTQRHDCRIFQDQSVPDIIEAVLKQARIPSDLYDLSRVQGKHEARPYCVQYNETDFNFISRLMEEEGIYYYFTHHFESQGRHYRHVMVLGNDPSSHPAIESQGKQKDQAEVLYKEPSGQVPDEECVYEYRNGNQIRPEAVMLRDFNYQQPSLDLSNRVQVNKDTNMEYYTYPGGFQKDEQGKKISQIRMEEKRSQYELGSGRSNCCRLLPGSYFKLEDHPHKNLNQQYLLLSIIQAGQQREIDADEKLEGFDKLINQVLAYVPLPSIGPFSPQQIYSNLKKIIDEIFGPDETFVYSNQFTCIPLGTAYRPARVTPKPKIHGPQTAIVETPGDKKSHVDDLGRVRVKFHWDRENKEDFNRTCDIRMAYSYAGSGHGIQFPPLAGDEVVVSFLEGDPDKPLITGVVYNGLNNPPLKPDDLPANVVLTPYQHRLLFNDRDAAITLNTGGRESIDMIDGPPDSKFGKQIKIATADEHSVHLCKGTKVSGIKIETQMGQKLALWDEPHPAGILVEDMDKVLSIQFNVDEKIITIKNESGPEININCSSGQVNVQGGAVAVNGGQVTIDGSSKVEVKSGGQVKIDGSGMVEVKSGGQVKIEAPAIEAQAAGSIKLTAPDITLEGATINLNAPMVSTGGLVQCKGLVQTPTLVAGSVIATSYTPGAGNIM